MSSLSYATQPMPKPPSAFVMLDEALSRLAEAADRTSRVATALCGEEPMAGSSAMLKAVPPSGLLGALQSDVERVNSIVEQITSCMARIESRLP